MTILAGDTVFPENAAGVIAARIPVLIDANLPVFRRPLRGTDPAQAVGVFPVTWGQDENSMEFQSLEPTLQRYVIVVQGLVQDTDEQAGISVHSILSKRLRSMLYRDTPLHTGLTSLSVAMNNSTERMQRRGITMQRFLSNEITGTFLYTSWIEMWLETETT